MDSHWNYVSWKLAVSVTSKKFKFEALNDFKENYGCGFAFNSFIAIR